MKKGFVLATLVILMGLLVAPTWAVEWTGQVVALYPEDQAFALDSEGTLVELQVVSQATDELRARYSQLKVGDTVKVDVNEQEMTAMAIEILPSQESPGQMEEPKALESMEPKSESAKGAY